MKRLLDDIKTFTGKVTLIAVNDNKIKKNLVKNNKIDIFELNRPERGKLFSKKRKLKSSSGKKVSIKKFRKIFKKKSVDYLVIDLNNVFDYYKYMASNSIYICSKKIYIYGNSDYLTAKDVAKKFRRYTKNIESIQIDNDYLVIVDCTNTKYRYFKEKFYLVIDSFLNIGDMISYFLTS